MTHTIRRLLDCNNNYVDIKIEQKHFNYFNNRYNYADVVLDIFNNDRCMDRYFANRKDLIILDIGANIGFFSLYAKCRAKRIISVEPTPEVYEILECLSKDYDNITTVNCAVANTEGDISFYRQRKNTTMNSITNKSRDCITVKGITLKKLMEDNNINHVDFVKCDIEGGETVIITDELLEETRGKIHEWYVQCHNTSFDARTNAKNIYNIFIKNGYTVDILKDGITIHAKFINSVICKLKELNDYNGASTITTNIINSCLEEFKDDKLYAVEMGVPYGGGVEKIGRIWGPRGVVWGFDTFETHPKYLGDICEYTKKDRRKFAATCMDPWYDDTENFGVERTKYDYIRNILDSSNLYNVHLIKGLVTKDTDVTFIPHLHYAFIDMDFPISQWDGWNLLKNKIVKGGYLCFHDMIPKGHIYGNFEIYQKMLSENLYDVILEDTSAYMVVLRKK